MIRPIPERHGQFVKEVAVMTMCQVAKFTTFGSEVLQTVEVPPCQYVDRGEDIFVEMKRQMLGDSPQAHRAARVATRTCLALGCR